MIRRKTSLSSWVLSVVYHSFSCASTSWPSSSKEKKKKKMRISWFDDAWRRKTEQTVSRTLTWHITCSMRKRTCSMCRSHSNTSQSEAVILTRIEWKGVRNLAKSDSWQPRARSMGKFDIDRLKKRRNEWMKHCTKPIIQPMTNHSNWQ